MGPTQKTSCMLGEQLMLEIFVKFLRTGESRTDPTELMLVRRRNSCPIFCIISAEKKISEIQRKQRRPLQTFVWHAYLPCFADDLWNVFCLFDFGRYQFFKL